ncbi:DinB family protein [Streptomonospora litoralis]|uniref:DinB superfamily protein n=1 Tax=Streptomonospora litoralis TaxID=2498135 RepID=A0A4P6Q207_9ACTN|nr:DinB family protein [Streptomonospora litoralis]QBI52879.1 DinB superfamily protein [Streptomonospora litoralis]
MAGKVRGVTEEQARRRLVSSETTLAGLLRHLAVVECKWFRLVVAGGDAEELHLPGRGESWVVPEDATLASLTADYERGCADSRAIAARYSLDDVFDSGEDITVSLRWILVHMIEETARHAGHADILREQTDGSTGDGESG